MKVSAKTKAKPTPVEVEVSLPNNLAEMQKAYGDELVYNAAKGAVVISLQAFMRRHIEKGSDQKTIQEAVKTWKPDTRTMVKMSAFEKVTSNIDKLSPEERKALLAKLTGAPAK